MIIQAVKDKIKDFTGKRRTHLKSVKWIWRSVREHMSWLVSVVLMGCFSALTGVLFSFFVKNIIDGATSGKTEKGNIILYGVLMVAAAALDALFAYLCVIFDEKIVYSIRRRVFSNVLHAQYSHIIDFRIGDVISRINNDAAQVSDFVSDILPDVIAFSVELAVTFIIVFCISWQIALVMIAIGIAASAFIGIIKHYLTLLQHKLRRTEANMNSFWNESCERLLIVKSFSKEDDFNERHDKLESEHIGALRKRARLNKTSMAVIDVFFDISYLIVFGWAVMKLTSGKISYGTLSMLIALEGYIQRPLVGIMSAIPKLFWSIVSADRLTELAEAPDEAKAEDIKVQGALGIKFNSLAFSYNGEKSVFKNFTEDIQPGSFVSVTGPSGSGKTTLTRLLLGFLSPDSGSIIPYDGTENFEYNIGIRKITGYVPQGNTLLTGSILDNVCFGLKNPDRETAEKALYLADAADFTAELPNGIDTVIGENSIGISEGQAQRIALARAIAAKPRLIILDEATSALDKQTEINILSRLKNMENRPTILCITHRDTALSYSDRNISIAGR